MRLVKYFDEKRKLRAVKRAVVLSERCKTRLWVLKIRPGKYRICLKSEVKDIIRANHLATRVNIFTVGGPIIHITKKITQI